MLVDFLLLFGAGASADAPDPPDPSDEDEGNRSSRTRSMRTRPRALRPRQFATASAIAGFRFKAGTGRMAIRPGAAATSASDSTASDAEMFLMVGALRGGRL